MRGPELKGRILVVAAQDLDDNCCSAASQQGLRAMQGEGRRGAQNSNDVSWLLQTGSLHDSPCGQQAVEVHSEGIRNIFSIPSGVADQQGLRAMTG